MNYPPQRHQDNDRDHLIEVIKTYPLATVISVANNTPYITHLPLILEGNNKLVGHIDKFNPQAELLQNTNDVTLIFSGPQCYISPSIYTTKQLPTWNYINVHLKGNVTRITDANTIKQSMVDMTSFLEAPQHKYSLDINDERMGKFVNYIEGFEIDITHWEGKFKLSQDKKPKDTENARNELIRANQESIKVFLDRVF